MSAITADTRTYRKIINSWCMYDWANSAFATTIMAAMFPPFYRSLATGAGLSEANATAAWAYTSSIALFIIAILAPVLGAISDHTGGKKWYIAFFAGMGILGTGLFVVLGESTYILASVLFIMGNVGFAGANIFYESLLPHIAKKGDIDQVSTRGYALGYVGGGILGPLLFGVVSQLTGASRLSIVSLIIFFLVGGLILTQVNVDEGRRVAQKEDAELGMAPAS